MNESHERPVDHQGMLRQAMHHTAAEQAAGQGPALPSLAELAARFPEFEIVGLIGRGGMGAVYRAVQPKLGRSVAIKVMPVELGKDPEFGERFLREARALATLNHPAILTVHDFGERDGQFFLVTEFVDGVNLRQLMELGELSPAEALRIAPQICTALQFAHERGIVHRDIKPENILVDTDGQVKIADFGLAKVAQQGDPIALTRSTAVFGTPHYMAPEQFRGTAAVDHRADIYSLGVVLYEMLTGQLPLGHFDPPSQRGGVPHGLDEVVRRALAQQPDKRYQQASEIRSDVERQAAALDAGVDPRSSARGAASRAAAADGERRPDAGGQPIEGVALATDARVVKGPAVAIAALLLGFVSCAFLLFLHERGRRLNYYFDADLERYTMEAESAVARIQAGEEVTQAASPMPVPPELVFSHEALPPMMLSVAIGTLLLVLALGFGAVCRIRANPGRIYGLGIAVTMAWIVPIGVATAVVFIPISAIRSNDAQLIIGLLAAAGIAVGGIWFLRFEVRRQRSLMAAGMPVRFGRGLIRATMVLAFLAFGVAALAPRAFPVGPQAYRYAGNAVFAEHLLGRTRMDVLGVIGPPAEISVSQNAQHWFYRDAKGNAEEALVIVRGEVIALAEKAFLMQRTADTGWPQEPALGQDLRYFTARFGRPNVESTGALTTRMRFADGTVVETHDGIVVDVAR
ncbi:MAG: serine/threonine protein kinase [bacterium]|nr:serine/threonine protein kinase [bacterium]